MTSAQNIQDSNKTILPLEKVDLSEDRTEICIDFRVNSIVIDTLYMDNAERLKEILFHIDQLCRDTTRNVTQVTFSGVASPEGNYQINRNLATKRLLALEKYIRSRIEIPEKLIIRHNDTYISWDYLIAEVQRTDIPHKEEVLSILHRPPKLVPYYSNRTVDSRVPALQKLDNGRVWAILYKRFFSKMRNACFVLITLKETVRPLPLVASRATFAQEMPKLCPLLLKQPEVPIPEVKEWTPHLYLKTNAVGLALAMANFAIEIDLAKHWSFNLPIYYSAWNYFKSTIKYRTLAIQPELRYWFSEENDGFFTGAHFGYAYYNFAFDGDYRFQDHNRETPAIGGGINVGYRLPISKNQRWKMEFSVGGGVYPLHYDKFYNTPRTKDGQLIESIKKTYWGIDQATVSLSYTFDLKKKGGTR